MARQETAGTIINRCAVEVGLSSVADPFSTTDAGFTQLTELLNVAGAELSELRPWTELIVELAIDTDTDITNDNEYALPTDYDRIVLQTAWDRTNDLPIYGPLNPQDWSYLLGRNLASNTIYVCYRIYNGVIEFFPDPVPTGRNLHFEYISRNWAETSGGTGIDRCTDTSDVVKLDPLLMQKFLKVKYLDAKGLPSQAARMEFENVLINRFGNDNGVPVLNAGGNFRGYPYLNGFWNTPDTNFGV